MPLKNTFLQANKLEKHTFEYKYVAYKWGATFNGQEKYTLTIRNTIKKLASEGLPDVCEKI